MGQGYFILNTLFHCLQSRGSYGKRLTPLPKSCEPPPMTASIVWMQTRFGKMDWMKNQERKKMPWINPMPFYEVPFWASWSENRIMDYLTYSELQ